MPLYCRAANGQFPFSVQPASARPTLTQKRSYFTNTHVLNIAKKKKKRKILKTVEYFERAKDWEMARETAKKNLKSNAARIAFFRQVTGALLVLQLVSAWFHSHPADDSSRTASVSSVLGFLACLTFWFGQEWLCISLLEKSGAPERDANGELLDCTDLSDPQQLGVMSYAQDVLWVCWAVQFLVTVVSSYCVILYLPVPILAVVKAFTSFVSPMLAARRSQQQEDSKGERGDDARSRLQRRREELRSRKGKTSKDD